VAVTNVAGLPKEKKETPGVSVSIYGFAKTSLVRYFEVKTDTLSP
jgi:hypothetical protein